MQKAGWTIHKSECYIVNVTAQKVTGIVNAAAEKYNYLTMWNFSLPTTKIMVVLNAFRLWNRFIGVS